ncbi:MAG: hypothetical protein HFH70_03045 [Lachnospiraceae bacterium]|jgi:FOG: HPt domain|nr:hypothetical protein [Lachnospiraceae bacterium]
MSLFDDLKALGVDIDEGVGRLGGNAALYEKLLGSFKKTIDTHYVGLDFDMDDYAAATDNAHAIKGTAGNLSITPIYKSYTDIVDLFRAGQPEQAKAELEKILPIQDEIIECITKHMNA